MIRVTPTSARPPMGRQHNPKHLRRDAKPRGGSKPKPRDVVKVK